MDTKESPEITMYAEFITSLKVANIYIGFKKELNGYSIRKIICEPQQIQVNLKRRTGSNCPQLIEWERLFSIALPTSVRLMPDTCSALQPTPYGWLLRLNMNEVDTNCNSTSSTHNMAPCKQTFNPKCRACGTVILKNGMENCITTCIPVSQLGLQSDMDLEEMDMSYFCHDHNHQHNCENGSLTINESDMKPQQYAAFVPKLNEVFICHTYYLLNADCIELPVIINSTKNEDLQCSRCHFILGKAMMGSDSSKGLVQLYVDAVTRGSISDMNTVMASFLKESSNNNRRLCIFQKDKLDDAPILLVWIMDWNLKIFKTQSTEQINQSCQKDVCKVLYKQVNLDSRLGRQWLTDSNVKKLLVHQSLLANLMSTLLKSTEDLPLAWRYANDFCVGHLDILA